MYLDIKIQAYILLNSDSNFSDSRWDSPVATMSTERANMGFQCRFHLLLHLCRSEMVAGMISVQIYHLLLVPIFVFKKTQKPSKAIVAERVQRHKISNIRSGRKQTFYNYNKNQERNKMKKALVYTLTVFPLRSDFY